MSWNDITAWAPQAARRLDYSAPGSVLLEGDCRSLLTSLPSASIDCVITSPPYGDQKDYGSPGEMGAGPATQFREELRGLLSELHRVCKEGAAFWLVLDSIKRNGADVPLPWEAASLATEVGWSLQDSVVWDKGKNLPWSHAGHLRGVCEHVLLFSKGKLRRFDIDGARESDHLSSYWVKYPERYHPAGKAPSDLWHFPIPVQGSWSGRSIRHLCPFPIGLVGRMLALTTAPGEVVLDPFAGSGSVIATASFLDRHGVGIELSRAYFNAFGKSGARDILDAAKHELRRNHGHGRNSLAVMIPQLRANKVAKTLFGQLSRSDRLQEEVTRQLLCFVVDARKTRGRNSHMVARISALLSSKKHIALVDREARALLAIPPLSKFGIEVSFQAAAISTQAVSETLKTSAHWHEYTSGRFNEFSRRLSTAQATDYIISLRGPRASRVPPIVSNLALRVLPTQSD